MKKAKKIIAIMLTVLTIISMCSAATSVFAAEHVEAQRRTEYFDSALSGYLKNIVDTENAVKISEKEEVEDAKNRENSTSGMSTLSLRGAQSTSVANALTREEVDIEHNILTLEMENGEKTAYIFSEPVSYMDEDGNLVYKDTSIIPVTDSSILNSGYTYQNSENDYKMYFGADSSVGVLLCSDLGSEIKLIPNGVNVAPGYVSSKTIDDIPTDTFEYDGVFGVSSLLRYFPQLNGCKEEIILSSYDGVSRFGFTLLTGDCIAAVNSSGQIEIIDKNKNILDTLKVPYAYDSSGGIDMTSEHYADCTYELEKTDDGVYMLTLVVPEDFLTDESTVYPVVIDPTTSTKYMYRDASVYSKYPTNSSFYNNETNCFGKSSDYGFGRVYSFFNLPDDLKNYATINSAYFWARETTGRTETMNVRPYIVNNTAWYNSMTWNTKPGYGDYTCSLKNINSNSSDGKGVYWYKFNIAKAVRAWTSGTANRGIVFVSNTEINDAGYLWRAFASMENSTSSYRPYAVISYTNDITAPTVSSVSNPKNGVWTNANVTVSITASDAASGIASSSGYSFDGGSSWQTSASKAYSSNGTYTVSAKAKDKAGNISSAKSGGTVKIDKTAPTVSTVSNPKNGVWSNANVTVSITATDALSGVGSYSFDGGSSWQPGSSKTYSAEGTYTISGKAKDNATNVSSAVSGGTVKIDKTAPVINSVVKSTTEWTRGSVSINIDATDALSGVAHYSFDGGTTWQTSNVYTAIENATLVVKVKDKAGNIATCAEPIVIDNIDKTPPKILATKIVSDGAQFLQIKASDEGSGLPLERYSYDLGETWTWLMFQPIDDDESITIMAKDELNNVATYIYNPGDTTISFEPTLEWTNEDITITVTGYDIIAYDFGNGFDSNNVCVLSENTTIPISTKHAIIGQNPTIEIREWGPLSFTNIDKVAPVISAVNVTPEGEWAKEDVTITVDAADVIEKESDGLSGLQTEAYSFDGGATWQAENTYTVTENGKTLNLAVRDNAGNITAWDEPITVLIDKTAPATPDIYEESGLVYIIPQNYVEGTASETVQYSLDGTNWVDYTEPLDIVRTYDAKVYAKVIDEAGNESDIAELILENNLGEYTVSFSDIAFGEGLFPVGFDRTYTSTGGWFFTFDANITKEDENTYVYTDFYGEKQYFIDSGDGKFESADGEELIITVSTNEETEQSITTYSLNYGDMVVEFGADRKLSKITTDYTTTEYTWNVDGTLRIANSLWAETDGAVVSFDEKDNPIEIKITRGEGFRNVEYEWEYIPQEENEYITHLDYFTDATGEIHTYSYVEGTEILTNNGTETITYANGRVRLIQQPNGAFVKYIYNDSAASLSNKTPGNIGAVTVKDSKGVIDTIYYSDGFEVTNSLDSYSDKAQYDPDLKKIAAVLEDQTENSISPVAYVVQEESALPPENNEPENNEPSTDGDTTESDGETATDNDAGDEANGVESDTDGDTSTDNEAGDLNDGEENGAESGGDNNSETDETETPLYEQIDDNTYAFYSYDTNKRVTVELEVLKSNIPDINAATFESAEAVAESKVTYVYLSDEDDSITEQISYIKSQNGLVPDGKECYTYDKGNVLTHSKYKRVGENDILLYDESYTYDDYGNVATHTETQYATDVDAFDVTYKTIYTYDVWGMCVKAEVICGDETDTTITEYDLNGVTLSVTYNDERVKYTYNDFGSVTTETVVKVNDDETETFKYSTTYTYDEEKGNLLTCKNPDGDTSYYHYDPYGNLTWHTFNDYYFEYNTLGSIMNANVGAKVVEKDEINEKDETNVKYEIEDKGTEIVAYNYVGAEQELSYIDYKNGQRINYTYDETTGKLLTVSQDEATDDLLTVSQDETTKFSYSYSTVGKDEITILTDDINNIIKVIENDKVTVKANADTILYSVENLYEDEKIAGSFNGKKITVGSDVYTLKSEENKDSFYVGETDTEAFIKTYENDYAGNLWKVNTANAVSTEYGYDDDKNVSTLKNTINGLKLIYKYEYDDEGNILSDKLRAGFGTEDELLNSEPTQAVTYTYDEDNQLLSAETADTKWAYNYDGRGNITSKTEYSVTVGENNEKIYTEVYSKVYKYEDEVWADKLTEYDEVGIEYDVVGNPVEYLGDRLTWTMGRQLAEYRITNGTETQEDDTVYSYTYNEDGIRTSKTVDNVKTEFYLDGTNIIEQITGTDVIHFHYDSSDEIIGFTYGENDYFYVKNSMGDITGITDINGNLVASYTYDPWGKVLDDELTAIGELNPFRYRSYYYDVETELYYLQSRYYDPEVGRFINSDDVSFIGATGSEISYNPFAYCENNPVNDSDPSGNFAWKQITAIFNELLSDMHLISEKIYDKYKVSANRYVQIKKYKTPSKILSFVNDNKKAIRNFNKGLAGISKFLGIVITISKVYSVLNTDFRCKRSVLKIVYEGIVNLISYVASDLIPHIVSIVCSALRPFRYVIQRIVNYAFAYFEDSSYSSIICDGFVTYLLYRSFTFDNCLKGLFTGVKSCFT